VSTDTYFRVSNGTGYDGTESHYGVGGKWGPDLGGGWDGRIWQWQDLQHTADANYQGNPRVISIETADNSPTLAEDIEPWTDAQAASLIDLIAWLCTPEAHADCPSSWKCHQEGIPAEIVPDTQSSRRGLAYHAQGAAEHTLGEWWSTSHSKPCPTRRRIDQFRTVVVPGVQQRLAGGPPDPTDQLEDIMALYPDAASFEAGVARAVQKGHTAALLTVSPYVVQALLGVPNSVFPRAADWAAQGEAAEHAEAAEVQVSLDAIAAAQATAVSALAAIETSSEQTVTNTTPAEPAPTTEA
jgi:hypothetical protein